MNIGKAFIRISAIQVGDAALRTSQAVVPQTKEKGKLIKEEFTLKVPILG
jgi:hypothetical protein